MGRFGAVRHVYGPLTLGLFLVSLSQSTDQRSSDQASRTDARSQVTNSVTIAIANTRTPKRQTAGSNNAIKATENHSVEILTRVYAARGRPRGCLDRARGPRLAPMPPGQVAEPLRLVGELGVQTPGVRPRCRRLPATGVASRSGQRPNYGCWSLISQMTCWRTRFGSAPCFTSTCAATPLPSRMRPSRMCSVPT